jgi:hypothetical protein
VPVAEEVPGRNFYPADISRQELDSYLAENPDDADVTGENLAADRKRLDDYPEVDALHPGLRERLESLEADSGKLYAVPYALSFAPELRTARLHLNAAADHIQQETPDFAAYLRNRARDLLSGDYESGDELRRKRACPRR